MSTTSRSSNTTATEIRADAARGRLLFSVFTVGFFVVFVLWLWYHDPGLLQKPLQEWLERTTPVQQQYLDWFLVSLAGTLLYAIAHIARFWPKREVGKARYRDYTPWYISTVIRGPFIAIVVLWLLTNVTFSTTQQGTPSGVEVDFGKLPQVVLTATAFILGFYSRVAQKQLDLFAQVLLGRAWALAQDTFEVVPNQPKVVFGRQAQFNTDPVSDVLWTVSLGTVEANSGLYTAPTKDVTPGTQDVVRAALRSQPAISAVALVTLVPFKISGAEQLKYGDTQVYLLDPAPEGTITWSVSPAETSKGGTIDAHTGKYTAPSRDSATTQVTILAKSDKVNYTDTLTVSLNE